jgi:hypothetical protein
MQRENLQKSNNRTDNTFQLKQYQYDISIL